MSKSDEVLQPSSIAYSLNVPTAIEASLEQCMLDSFTWVDVRADLSPVVGKFSTLGSYEYGLVRVNKTYQD